MEERHDLYFLRLSLVVGTRAFKRALNKSSARVGVGWAHLSGGTKHETKDEATDSFVDFSRRIDREPLVHEKTSIGRMNSRIVARSGRRFLSSPVAGNTTFAARSVVFVRDAKSHQECPPHISRARSLGIVAL